MRRVARAVAPLLVAVLLGTSGCALNPPTPSPTVAPSSAAPSTASPSPSTTPTPTGIVLAADAIGDLPFGTARATVTTLLTGHLGKPTATSSGHYCELDAHSAWSEVDVYHHFWVEYRAKDAKKASPRVLSGWGFQVEGKLPSALAIADAVPLDQTFAQLRTAYPGTRTLHLGLPDGTVAVQLPNGLIFYGVKKPEVVRGGAIGVCE